MLGSPSLEPSSIRSLSWDLFGRCSSQARWLRWLLCEADRRLLMSNRLLSAVCHHAGSQAHPMRPYRRPFAQENHVIIRLSLSAGSLFPNTGRHASTTSSALSRWSSLSHRAHSSYRCSCSARQASRPQRSIVHCRVSSFRSGLDHLDHGLCPGHHLCRRPNRRGHDHVRHGRRHGRRHVGYYRATGSRRADRLARVRHAPLR